MNTRKYNYLSIYFFKKNLKFISLIDFSLIAPILSYIKKNPIPSLYH
jgi:hypothetical protein